MLAQGELVMRKLNRVGIVAVYCAMALGAGVARGDGGGGDELLDLYGRMHAALADDNAAGVSEAAAQLGVKAEAAAAMGAHSAAFDALAAAARAVSGTDLAALRERYRAVSIAMAGLIEAGALAGADLYYCPMADAYWLQKSADAGLKNPYYGKSMLKCGSKVDRVES
jgi:hypothetical protein